MINKLEKYVNDEFEKLLESEITVDSDKISNEFEAQIQTLSDEELVDLLITAGYIPDIYGADSREETLFTKLCEVLEVSWAKRMGYESYFVTQKASYEDVVIKIDGQVIVSDTKSFRLSRSQAAPNVKDFVKPEDYRKWINRHTGNKLGGLVVFPQLHEWSKGSDAHTYCSDKDNPILMLPFHYLAYLLSARNRLGFNASDVCQLWDYNRLFPSKVKDRIVYWKVINHAILSITNDTPDEMIKFLEKSEQRMYRYVVETLTEINGIKVAIKDRIIAELREMGVEEIKELFMRYRIQTETDGLNTLLQRIADFRLENQHTKYRSFIRKSF